MAEAVETLDHDEMARALIEGTAVCLSHTITRYVRYAGAWWAMAPFAWVKLTDRRVLASFDELAPKFADADDAVQASVECHAPFSHGVREEGR